VLQQPDHHTKARRNLNQLRMAHVPQPIAIAWLYNQQQAPHVLSFPPYLERQAPALRSTAQSTPR
jgi:hypothetical protein